MDCDRMRAESARAFADLANERMVAEDWEAAEDLYTAAIAEKSTEAALLASALTGRSSLYVKVGKFTAALQDANAALKLASKNEAATYWKARASFEVEEFETAQAAFKLGLSMVAEFPKLCERRKYAMWLRKCEAELDDETSDEEEDEASALASAKPPPPPAQEQAVATKPPLAQPAPSAIKYQYYQTATHVTVTVMARGVTAETSEIVIKDKALTVRIVKEGFEMTVINGELYDPVVVDDCSVKFAATKVEIKLKKKEHFNWNELLMGACIGDDPKEKAKHAPPRRPAQNSTTTTVQPYASKRDWNQLEKDLESELAKDKPEGEEALNKLFQDIYGKATPETRRAMNKSFQTSGGTVLSTNWGEVEKADYETDRQAPSGMEWKNWEGDKLPQKDSD